MAGKYELDPSHRCVGLTGNECMDLLHRSYECGISMYVRP
jgi:hypothetical protein